MNNIPWRLLGLLLIAVTLTGCYFNDFPMYRMATDGRDKKVYFLVGRVMDSHARPIQDCRVFLSIYGLDCTVEHIPPAVTDATGMYQFAFDLKRCYYDYELTFNAVDQGYSIRHESISHLLESTLFQYTGNNPVVMNVVLNKAWMSRPVSRSVEPATGF